MVKAIRFHEFGGPEVLKFEDISVGDPAPEEVRIRHTAIGFNFLDALVRAGKYPVLPELPAIPGAEGAGVVEAVGGDVKNLAVGQRVVYAATIPGAYTEARLIEAHHVVALPDAISEDDAAASFLKGMTVEYLIKRCYRISEGETALVHAAAGGVGQIMCQWLKHLGVVVIGATTSEEKKDLILSNGAAYAVNSSTENIGDVVEDVTGGEGVNVVYDSVGPDVWSTSIDTLRPRGYYVNYGNSSGPLAPINAVDLNVKGSLFFTKTSMRFYQLTREELENSAAALFDVMERGIVRPVIGQRYDLSDAAQAQIDIMEKRTTGSTILVP